MLYFLLHYLILYPLFAFTFVFVFSRIYTEKMPYKCLLNAESVKIL